jgi:hypothetical protein
MRPYAGTAVVGRHGTVARSLDMKLTIPLLAGALAAGGLAIPVDSEARRGDRSGAHASSGHRGHGGGHPWRGHRGHGHWGGGASWGIYFGAPLVLGAGWGWPYYADFGYPRETIIYREREVHPREFDEAGPEATTEVPRGAGTPSQGPLYMNYCESARAYFPRVTSCPEGWKLATPTN